MNSIIRQKRVIAMIYHLTILVMVITGVSIKNGFLVAIGILHLLTFQKIPIARIIQSRLITHTICSSCGNSINLSNYWKCGCGYISPNPRHAFLPCPACGKTFKVIKCHVCEVGILV